MFSTFGNVGKVKGDLSGIFIPYSPLLDVVGLTLV